MSPFIAEECCNTLCGRLIGEGMSRKVFECKLDSRLVVKVEAEDDPYFQNMREMLTWDHVRDAPDTAKWFAPVMHTSPHGRVLVMERTEPVPVDLLPRRIPRFLSDTKPANWGLLRGKVVCHDYGTNVLMTYGQTKATKRAEWR